MLAEISIISSLSNAARSRPRISAEHVRPIFQLARTGTVADFLDFEVQWH